MWPNKTIQRQDILCSRICLSLPCQSPPFFVWYLFIVKCYWLSLYYLPFIWFSKSVIRASFLKCKPDHVIPLPRLFAIGHRMKSVSLCMARKDFHDLSPSLFKFNSFSSPSLWQFIFYKTLTKSSQDRIVLLWLFLCFCTYSHLLWNSFFFFCYDKQMEALSTGLRCPYKTISLLYYDYLSVSIVFIRFLRMSLYLFMLFYHQHLVEC